MILNKLNMERVSGSGVLSASAAHWLCGKPSRTLSPQASLLCDGANCLSEGGKKSGGQVDNSHSADNGVYRAGSATFPKTQETTVRRWQQTLTDPGNISFKFQKPL